MLSGLFHTAKKLTNRSCSALEFFSDCRRIPLKNQGEPHLSHGFAVKLMPVELWIRILQRVTAHAHNLGWTIAVPAVCSQEACAQKIWIKASHKNAIGYQVSQCDALAITFILYIKLSNFVNVMTMYKAVPTALKSIVTKS